MLTKNAFYTLLEDSLYKTTGKILGSLTVSAVHYKEMFERLDLPTATILLEAAIEYDYFYPDWVDIFTEILEKRRG